MTDRPGNDLQDLRDEIDRSARRLEKIHAKRLRCESGCTDCCVDGLTVFEVEAEVIRRNHGELLRSGEPHPEGRCAFLDGDGACRIYEDRPYVCRTQGLPLRWFETTDERNTVECRDICPLNVEGEPVAELPADQCWKIGPTEGRLAAIQAGTGRPRERVALRDLFSRRD